MAGKINYGSFVCDDFHANYLSHLPSGVSQDARLWKRRSLGKSEVLRKGGSVSELPKVPKALSRKFLLQMKGSSEGLNLHSYIV